MSAALQNLAGAKDKHDKNSEAGLLKSPAFFHLRVTGGFAVSPV